MKLHKNKVRILLAGIVILTIITSVLCSFTLPDYSSESDVSLPDITLADAENIMAIVNYQHSLGQFNNLVPVLCYLNSSKTELRILLLNPAINYSLSFSGNSFTITNNNSTPGNFFRYIFYMSDKGFTSGNPTDNFDSATGFTSFSATNALFYRNTMDSSLVINSNYSFPSGNGHDVFIDIVSYWHDFYSLIVNYEDNIEDAESNGYSNGYSEGESVGYQDGYVDGFDSGMDYGYQFGYQDGVATGRSEGYSHGYLAGEAVGYESGYADGYDDGYAAAEPGDGEVVTEIIYRDAVDLDIPLIFDGMADATNGIFKSVDFDLFGINILGVLLSLTILTILVFILKRFKS